MGIEIDGKWVELSQVAEFQQQLKILIANDQKSNQSGKNGAEISLWLRKAVITADQKNVRVFALRLAPFIYAIVAEVRTESDYLATSFLLEDGIADRRRQVTVDHPLHFIACLTDVIECGREARMDQQTHQVRQMAASFHENYLVPGGFT